MDLNSTEKTVVPLKLTRVSMGEKTDMGMVRRRNEDDLGHWVPSDPEEAQRKGYLYIVADGMGGHLAGDRASELAVSIITKTYYEDPSLDIGDSLHYAIETTNARIHEEATERTKAGMGTTVVCAVVRGHEVYIAHVGDSRAYLARGQAMQRLTEDHSWVEDQVRAGIINQEDARTHPQRNIITRSLGSRPEVEVDTQRRIIQEGDVILLCSDGLSGPVADEEIQEAILSYEPQEACDKLIGRANENGGPDNVTAIAVRIDEVVTTPPELVPERYKSLPAADASTLVSTDFEQTAVSIQTVPAEPSPTVETVAVPLPESRPAGSRLRLVVLGLLAIVAVALCALSAGLWSLGPLSPFSQRQTPATALAVMPTMSPKAPLQGNQTVATSTATPLPATPTLPPPTPTPSPSPTIRIPTLTLTLVPLVTPPPPTLTPEPLIIPTEVPTVPIPTLVQGPETWLQESTITVTVPLTDSPQIPLTVAVSISSTWPISVSAAPAVKAEEWTLHFNISQTVTFTGPVPVELGIAVSPDSRPLRRGTLNLGGESLDDLLGERGVTVNIRLESATPDGDLVPGEFELLLLAPPPLEADPRPALLLRAEPSGQG
jgi:serine/threonine protein phosphatase PrpC